MRFVVVALLFASMAVGCKTAEPKPAASRSEPAAAPAPAPAAPAPSSSAPSASATKPDLSPLLFTYDEHLLEADAQARLKEIAAYLAATDGLKVRISGHADERGTSEYNLALGDARARAARDYLVKLGIDPSRILFESRGEENPADPGHDEGAWQKNRRDEVQLIGG